MDKKNKMSGTYLIMTWEYGKVGEYLQWARTSLKKEVWNRGLVDSMLRVTLVS